MYGTCDGEVIIGNYIYLGEAEVEDLDVDVTTCEKILAFVSSDEEDEDKGCLLYLPIAPEVEDPEDTLLNVVKYIYFILYAVCYYKNCCTCRLIITCCCSMN